MRERSYLIENNTSMGILEIKCCLIICQYEKQNLNARMNTLILLFEFMYNHIYAYIYIYYWLKIRLIMPQCITNAL